MWISSKAINFLSWKRAWLLAFAPVYRLVLWHLMHYNCPDKLSELTTQKRTYCRIFLQHACVFYINTHVTTHVSRILTEGLADAQQLEMTMKLCPTRTQTVASKPFTFLSSKFPHCKRRNWDITEWSNLVGSLIHVLCPAWGTLYLSVHENWIHT
jgi:hypothetical protein